MTLRSANAEPFPKVSVRAAPGIQTRIERLGSAEASCSLLHRRGSAYWTVDESIQITSQ